MSLQSCSVADVEFQSEFTLESNVDGQLTALVGFFDVEFQSVPHKKSFTTSPYNIPTHWKQTVFLLQTPISVVTGKCTDCNGHNNGSLKYIEFSCGLTCELAFSFAKTAIYELHNLCTFSCYVNITVAIFLNFVLLFYPLLSMLFFYDGDFIMSHIFSYILYSDVKRGQNAVAKAEAKTVRPRPWPEPRGQGRGRPRVDVFE